MTRLLINTRVSRRSALLAVGLVCLAFALKALLLIDATSLWSDELYSVGKSFQPDFAALLALLRQDTHPPLYYSLLWLWGGCWVKPRSACACCHGWPMGWGQG